MTSTPAGRSAANSFGARAELVVGERSYEIYRIHALPDVDRLPMSLKVLLENQLRTEDGRSVTR